MPDSPLDVRARLLAAGFNADALQLIFPILAGALLPAPEPEGAAPKLLDYDEAARFLGLPVGTLQNRVSARTIPFLRIGARSVRFEPEALLSWARAASRTGNQGSSGPATE